MLKFLTHKLRTHSLNEENYIGKGDEDHDSGTESDEEIDGPDLPEIVMSERSSISPADTGCSGGSSSSPHSIIMDALHDPHSSEEELEVINSPKQTRVMTSSARPQHRAASVCLPEKRKWSQINADYGGGRGGVAMTTTPVSFMDSYNSSGYGGANSSDSTTATPSPFSPENEENMSHFSNLSPRRITSPISSPYAKFGASTPDDTPIPEHSSGGSSDDEVHHLLHASMSTPVQFRTSPPLEAVKPGGGCRAPQQCKGRSLSPPPKLIHCEVSPRKRSRHARHAHIQRPCLDFEKMQQLKARSVTAWRHSGDHSGELSVFCW